VGGEGSAGAKHGRERDDDGKQRNADATRQRGLPSAEAARNRRTALSLAGRIVSGT